MIHVLRWIIVYTAISTYIDIIILHIRTVSHPDSSLIGRGRMEIAHRANEIEYRERCSFTITRALHLITLSRAAMSQRGLKDNITTYTKLNTLVTQYCTYCSVGGY